MTVPTDLNAWNVGPVLLDGVPLSPAYEGQAEHVPSYSTVAFASCCAIQILVR